MQRLITVVLIVLAAGCFVSPALAKHSGRDDTQYWNELVFEFGINEKWDGRFKTEQNFTDDAEQFTLHNYDVGAAYIINDIWKIEFAYKYELEKEDGEWFRENRYQIIPTAKWHWDMYTIQLQNRLAYRDLEDKNIWRLREKLKVAREVSVGGVSVGVFVADAVYYDFDAHMINQNRAYIGVEKELMPQVEGVLYYMYKSNKSSGSWSEAHIIGTEFVFKIF